MTTIPMSPRKHKHKVSKTKPGTDAFCASVASGAATVVANPFEVAKTRLQLQHGLGSASTSTPSPTISASAKPPRYHGSIHALVSIWRNEGTPGLYRGFAGFAGYRIAMNGPRLGFFHPAKRFLRSQTPTAVRHLPESAHTLVASAMTGLMGSITGNPFNVIKVRCMNKVATKGAMGVNVSDGFQVAQEIARSEGLKGFFRGLSAAGPRVMAGSASQLTSYEFTKHSILDNSNMFPSYCQRWIGEDHWEVHAAASVAAGFVSTTCFCPFDVISSRLYMPGNAYKGFWDCTIRTVRNEGWMALQRGWLAVYARTGPTSTVTMVLWESLRKQAGCED